MFAPKSTAAVLALLTALLVATAASSLGWRMQHDAPLMLYFALLIDRFDLIPYRDFFEHQPPGAHLAYLAIGKLTGYTDLGLRVFDLAYLAAILAVTVAWLRRLGGQVAWAGAVLFGLAYLGYGPRVSVQRDYLMLLPVAAAAWVQVCERSFGERTRALLAGGLLGIAATLKPQVCALAPALLGFQLWRAREARGGTLPARAWLPLALAGAGGLLAAPLAALLWLLATGSLGAFVDIVRGYWPLFAQLDGEHRVVSGWPRWIGVLDGTRRLGGHALWLAPIALGLGAALAYGNPDRRARAQLAQMGSLALLAVLVPAAAGRFWDYHWLLFLYFAIALASLCLLTPRSGERRALRLMPPLVLLLVVFAEVNVPGPFRAQLLGRGPAPLEQGRVDAIAEYLAAHLEPGDTVQPLDWTGGGIHAMLIARARVATPFVTDFSLYHHVSHPYVRGLRREFARSLWSAPPRFVIRVDAGRPWPSGPDTSRWIEELDRLLARDYRVDLVGPGFRIYRRAPSS